MSSQEPSMRVAVALSGGVDSALTAALLKEQGHEVLGLTMALLEDSDQADARRVAQALNIPLHIFDMKERFSSRVCEPFADSYLRGETPLPCALCNKELKFGALMSEAQKLGAQALATGHYARRLETIPGQVELHVGVDVARDQSYFLFALSAEQLAYLRFPLGEMTKKETRALALQKALPVAEKPDSQDICFVPDGDYAAVLEKLRPGACEPGEIVDETGVVVGYHEGIVRFTIGQRRGLNLGLRQGDHNEPLFVLRLDAVRRQVVVGPQASLARTEVFLRDVNWLADDVEPKLLEVQVKLRSTQKSVPAEFSRAPDGTGLMKFAAPVLGVSPGQAGVIYRDSRLLGGGWISGAA